MKSEGGLRPPARRGLRLGGNAETQEVRGARCGVRGTGCGLWVSGI
jgi:hypothetical protein